jgi:hypothetical protein
VRHRVPSHFNWSLRINTSKKEREKFFKRNDEKYVDRTIDKLLTVYSPSPYIFILYYSRGGLEGSIPDGVIGIFQLHNPSGRTMALWSTQPLTEMSTRCISWG